MLAPCHDENIHPPPTSAINRIKIYYFGGIKKMRVNAKLVKNLNNMIEVSIPHHIWKNLDNIIIQLPSDNVQRLYYSPKKQKKQLSDGKKKKKKHSLKAR